MEEERQDTLEESPDWRQRFIWLAEDVCRLHGQPAAMIVDDPDNYLSMSVAVDGTAFDVLHFPEDPERLVVHCKVGAVPKTHHTDVLKNSLATNMHLAWSHTGMFALDTDSDELIYSTFEPLHGLTAEQLMHNMAAMAGAAGPWAERFAQPSA